MNPTVFLHGGGDDPHSLTAFVGAVKARGSGPLALVYVKQEAEPDEAYSEFYGDFFADLGLPQSQQAFIAASPEHPLTADHLSALAPAGLFVCGGLTPRYRAALTATPDWPAYLRTYQLPYAGSSAGAAIASARAIVGGWRAVRGAAQRQILYEGAAEGLEPLTVLPGLGLVPLAVDVHASQWGTLSRLVQAVDLGLVQEGVAIDENTTLAVDGGLGSVTGSGHVFHARRRTAGVTLSIYVTGEEFTVGAGAALS